MTKLIVASQNELSLVNTETNSVSEFLPLPEDSSPYGITWSSDFLFAAIRGNGGSGQQKILVYDKKLNLLDDLSYGSHIFADLHQIMWYDNKLWVVSSGLNLVVIITFYVKSTSYRIWEPNPFTPQKARKTGHPITDRNHFNSIWFESSRVYLVAHNFEQRSEIWEFSYPSLELTKRRLSGHYAHNVCRIDGDLMTLSTDPPPPVYNRGLAVSADKIFTGQSVLNEDRKARREEIRGSVLVWNKKWELEKEISIDRGEVYDVRLIDEPDFAHHGMVLFG